MTEEVQGLRGKRKGENPKRVVLPPPLPPVEDLDAISAAPDASLTASWWRSHQVTEHVFAAIAQTDPRTGDPLPQSLVDLMHGIREVTAEGCRPFPHDQLFIAAQFAAEPLARLLEHHRHRIVRTHEQLPFHRLREFDARSIAWLARQPGRNIREKLSGRTHALGVKRDVTADTAENQLLRAFAQLLVRRVRTRTAHADAYDQRTADKDRLAVLVDAARVCSERLRQSEIADVALAMRVRPNNVLLSDPLYSRVFRAWKWLRDEESDLQRSWSEVVARVRELLFWIVAARLADAERVIVCDTLARVSMRRDTDASVGIELVGPGSSAWMLNPPLQFLVLPRTHNDCAFQIRLSLHGGFLLAHVASLEGRGLLREGSMSSLSFEVRPEPQRVAAGRGIAMMIDGVDSAAYGANRNYADIAGMKALADQISGQILAHCAVRFISKRSFVAPHPLMDADRVGLELGGVIVRANDGRPRGMRTRAWSAALTVPGDHDAAEWLDGRNDRRLAGGTSSRSIWALHDVLDPPVDANDGELALVARRVVSSIASELSAPASATIAYTVPDSSDAFSQRTIRTAFSASFNRPLPVWRSIAGATGWVMGTSAHLVSPGDHVVVVDAEFSAVTITLLVAAYDARLERAFPESRGVHWERRPPLPPNEQLEQLGWPNLLRAYGRNLLARDAGNDLDPEECERTIEDLARTGVLASLVERGGSIFVELAPRRNGRAEALELSHDSQRFRAEVDRWMSMLAEALGPELQTLRARRSATHVLLLGGPSVLDGFSDVGIRNIAVELERWVRVHVASTPATSVAFGARECLRRKDAKCVAWKEWLPDLSLEVVRDGHYGDLPLIDRDRVIDPFLGVAVDLEVPERLTLARGQKWYSFPLMVGREGRRPLIWEARLESPAFPLVHDVRAVIRLSYSYGMDATYELVVEPESPAHAPFARIQARWLRAGDSAPTIAPLEPPEFGPMSWAEQDEAEFLKFANLTPRRLGEQQFAAWLRDLVERCWAGGRSIAAATAKSRAAFVTFRDHLRGAVPASVSLEHLPRAIEILACLHEDAPAETRTQVLALDDQAGDEPLAYKRIAPLLSCIVGDGRGERAPHLDRLLARLLRHSSFETFDPAMVNTTMRAITNAVWRHPGLIFSIQRTPGAVAVLVTQCRRSLQNLLTRVPMRTIDKERERVLMMYGLPYRDACETLLALLRLGDDPQIASLQCGTPSADAIAKNVRQLDSRFSRAQIEVPWTVPLGVHPPTHLRRMSPTAFVLNNYLADGAGMNLVHVGAPK